MVRIEIFQIAHRHDRLLHMQVIRLGATFDIENAFDGTSTLRNTRHVKDVRFLVFRKILTRISFRQRKVVARLSQHQQGAVQIEIVPKHVAVRVENDLVVPMKCYFEIVLA
jgi:hypothetical protein